MWGEADGLCLQCLCVSGSAALWRRVVCRRMLTWRACRLRMRGGSLGSPCLASTRPRHQSGGHSPTPLAHPWGAIRTATGEERGSGGIQMCGGEHKTKRWEKGAEGEGEGGARRSESGKDGLWYHRRRGCRSCMGACRHTEVWARRGTQGTAPSVLPTEVRQKSVDQCRKGLDHASRATRSYIVGLRTKPYGEFLQSGKLLLTRMPFLHESPGSFEAFIAYVCVRKLKFASSDLPAGRAFRLVRQPRHQNGKKGLDCWAEHPVARTVFMAECTRRCPALEYKLLHRVYRDEELVAHRVNRLRKPLATRSPPRHDGHSLDSRSLSPSSVDSISFR